LARARLVCERTAGLLFSSTLLAVAMVLLALPAPAAAAIVPQRGIGGVTLGMTNAAVRSTAGSPIRVRNGTNEFGAYRIVFYPTFQVTFQGLGRVTGVSTVSPAQRTARGIGVGSRKAQVQARVAGVVCEPGDCHVGALLPGRRVTSFILGANGRVTRVVVGFVID